MTRINIFKNVVKFPGIFKVLHIRVPVATMVIRAHICKQIAYVIFFFLAQVRTLSFGKKKHSDRNAPMEINARIEMLRLQKEMLNSKCSVCKNCTAGNTNIFRIAILLLIEFEKKNLMVRSFL